MKNKATDKFKQRYKDYRKEVQEQMNIIIDNYDIEEGFTLTLDLLAFNLDLLYKSMDSLRDNGFTTKDWKDRPHKNYAIQQLNQSQATILKILGNFPSSTMLKERIKKLSSLENDDEQMLENLINN